MRIIDPDSAGDPSPQAQDGPGKTDGGANLRLMVRDGKLIVHLGKPVLWIGFTKTEAFQLADGIRAMAARL